MSPALYALCMMILGQGPFSSSPTQSLGGDVRSARPTPVANSGLYDTAVKTVADEFEDSALAVPPPPTIQPNGAVPTVFPPVTGEVPPEMARLFRGEREPFQSDHEFDGFTGPLSNPVQFKDPRALTEARLLFMGDFSRPSTPVLRGGTAQVYALQLRIALSERLQIFADKDGIVRISPKGGTSVTGLANINAGAKYVWIRDVENQLLFSTVVQYEAPTGYANIFQRNGSGLLGVFAVIGKEFADDWHILLQFGQNFPMQNQQSGYFMTDFHIDRRIGKITPFYEANWFYYNQPGHNLPLGIEGGGWINLGSQNINGLNYLTNAVGAKVDLSERLELGVGFEFQVSNRVQLLNNMIHAQLIYRY